MQHNITLNVLKRLHPSTKTYFMRSTRLRGFGVKVNPTGIIKFIAETKYQGKNYRREVGTFPVMSIPEAEKAAMQFLNHVQTGQYHADIKNRYTLRELFKVYISKVSLKPSTLKSYSEVVTFYLQDWLDKPLLSIDKKSVEKRFFTIRDKGIHGGKPTYSQATKVMRVLSALMNYAMADELIESNPVNVLKLKRIDRSIIKREHYLRTEEVRQLLQITALETHPVTLAIHLMLYTGLRKNEALRLKWCNMQDINGIFCLLIGDTKNSRPHYVPVTCQIQEILNKAKNETEYVFPSPQKENDCYKFEGRTVRRIAKTLEIPFTCHDLRRTFATRASEIGIDYMMIKRLLNHKTNDITAQYIQWHSRENLEVMKRALESVVY